MIRSGDVAVEGDKIIDVGESLRAKYGVDRIIDAKRKLVLPGLIDTHTHFITQLDRGMTPEAADTSSFIAHLLSYLKCLTAKDIYYGSLLLCVELLKNGVTCLLDNGSFFYEETIRAVRESGIRGVVGRWLTDNPPFPSEGTEAELKSTEKMLERYAVSKDGMIRAWVTPMGTPGMSCSDELLIGAKNLADRYKVGVNMHSASSIQEVKVYQEKKGRSPIRHLDALGVLGPNVSLIHMICVDAEEIEILKSRDVKVIHCPSTALFLTKGLVKYGMFPEMISRGVNVSLGTDSADSSNFHDIVREMYLAALLFRDIRFDPTLMGAELAIEMATVNGAKTILSERELGSIEVGKKADITIFDMRRPEWTPVNNEVNNLVYSASGDSADTVIVNGRVVMEGRRLAMVDELEVIDKAQQLANDILGKVGARAVLKPPWHFV